MNSQEILDREFLEIRAKILEIAASLDRIERADGDVATTEEMGLIEQGISILASNAGATAGRASAVQLLFSREYEADWKDKFEIKPRS